MLCSVGRLSGLGGDGEREARTDRMRRPTDEREIGIAVSFQVEVVELPARDAS